MHLRLRVERATGVSSRTVARIVGLICVALSLARSGGAQTDRTLPEGPWGNVELEPIKIRLPAYMVPGDPLPLLPWLVTRNKDVTSRLLMDAGVESVLAERILSTYRGDSGGTLEPTVEMIRALDPEARARLYEVLRASHENSGQRNPHRFRRARLTERFRDLAPQNLELLREFLYETPRLPGVLLLADLPAVSQLIDSPAERVRLIQAVSEQESVLLRVQLDPSSNASALAEYWGRGGRRRDLEILLDSLIDSGSPRRLDAIYLLPSFARGFLLTYPQLENAARRDCFWTALNFFLPVPDDRLEGARLSRTMVEDYEHVKGSPLLGDMLVLWRESGEAEHAAVYIAGDIYFTKNGNNLAMPWLLMPLEDILERYDDAERAPLTHYRLKTID